MPESLTATGLYTDRYELAMAAAYWRDGRAEEPAVFDYFFRTLPFGSGFAVFAGLATAIEALQRFRYTDDHLAFLAADGFSEDFLEHLRRLTFRGHVWAAPEGELVFPLEPLVRVEGTLIEAQIIETLLLNILNFQTLVATKAARCRRAAGDRGLSEFGLRRAQGLGGKWASRAACIGGFTTTSNLEAAYAYGLTAAGTMAHSFVQSYVSELEAFRRFASVHGASAVLLLDTYDTLRSGLPNALTVARELAEQGLTLAGVRLDSGDFAYLSREVRARLDAEGFKDVAIVASNQLDERVIHSLIQQGSPIDLFGVGTSIATGSPDAALDGVYKLASINGQPRLKLSENVAKSTLPGRKAVTRYTDVSGSFIGDVVHLSDESDVPSMIHPFEPQKRLDLKSKESRPLFRRVMSGGEVVAPLPSVFEAAEYAQQRLAKLPPEHLRFDHPHIYKIGLSPRLRALREELIENKRKELSA